VSTPETKVKQRVRKVLEEHDAYCFLPATGGYGRSGIPDIVGCYNGCFFAVECKAGRGTTTALQEKELRKIREAGGSSGCATIPAMTVPRRDRSDCNNRL
jgi:Holliday junction resolvase